VNFSVRPSILINIKVFTPGGQVQPLGLTSPLGANRVVKNWPQGVLPVKAFSVSTINLGHSPLQLPTYTGAAAAPSWTVHTVYNPFQLGQARSLPCPRAGSRVQARLYVVNRASFNR
jgi:hypothetical protein